MNPPTAPQMGQPVTQVQVASSTTPAPVIAATSPIIQIPFWPTAPAGVTATTPAAPTAREVYILAKGTNGLPMMTPVDVSSPSAAAAANPGATFMLPDGSVVRPK
jgi:hypothetical protein